MGDSENVDLREEVSRLKHDIEAYKSQRDWYKNYILKTLTEKENDAMDDIAMYRTKRVEIERFDQELNG